MEKLEFYQRLTDVRERLPKSVVPMFIIKFPEYEAARVQNVISGRTFDEGVLQRLEELADLLNN